MFRSFLKAKIHRVTTTVSNVDYEGSCEIDGVLLDAAGIGSYEQIQIYNINNGNRFSTYAIRGKDNSGIISVNGAAAHKADVGDILIIASYAFLDEKEISGHKPSLCYVDKNNNLIEKK